MSEHWVDFAPADAVQYTAETEDYIWETLNAAHHKTYSKSSEGYIVDPSMLAAIVIMARGQWLVRQGSRVWVQDEEPARVERWETGRMSPGGDVWDHDWLSWWPEYRRPVLSNGWTGPWSPIEGGAE